MSVAKNGDTVSLLKECNAGCKMATSSIEQLSEYIHTPEFKKLVDEYNNEHVELGDECHALLNEVGEDEKDPHPMAKAMSWMTSEVKMSINGDEKKAAKILMEGCSMGIQSLSEYINKYSEADASVLKIAMKLRNSEEEMLEKLEQYV